MIVLGKNILSTLLVAGSAALLCMSGTSRAEEHWVAYSYLPSTNMSGVKALEGIARDFGKATNGNIKITVNVGGSLPIPGNAVTQAVGDGIVQMGDDGFFSGNVEVGGIMGLPLLFNSWSEYEKGLQILMPTLEKAFAK